MASRYAVASGNWSNTATWDGGTLPQPGDDVRSNGFTVTVNQNVNVASIQNTALSPAVAGGSFVVSTSGYTIQANVISVANCLTYNAAITLNIIGNCIPLSSGAAVSSNNTSSILYVVGNLYGRDTGFGGNGVLTSGTIFLTGDCIGSTNNNDALSLNSTSSNATITGNLITATGQGRAIGVYAASCTIVINGNIIAGIGNGIGQTPFTATVTVNGNIIGGNNGTGINQGGGLLTVNGDIIGGNNGDAITIGGGQLLGNYVVYGSSIGRGAGINSTGVVDMSITNATFGSNGTSPVIGRVKFANSGAVITVVNQNNTTATYTDVNSQDQADQSDVRQGTTYANGALTGTLAVPNPSTVSLGVPTDNTTGTLPTSSVVAADLLNEIANSSIPLAERLRNVATTSIVNSAIGSINVIP